MFATLFASAVAGFAIIRAAVLAGRLRSLRGERDRLRVTVAEQRSRIEELEATGHQPPEPLTPSPVLPPPDEARPAAPTPLGDIEAEAPASIEDPLPDTSAPAPTPTAVDWESFLGVRGAAWMAGVAFILSAIFFARWTIEQELLGAGMVFTGMLMAGITGMGATEILRRGRVGWSAGPVAAASLAILFAAVLAGHERYALITPLVTFLLVSALTVAGGLVALRHGAFAPALVAVAGGIAGALVLAEGATPVGAFTGMLLLNAGVLWLVSRQPWFGLVGATLAGTLALQIRWFSEFLSPETLGFGLATILVFGSFYLALPLSAGGQVNRHVLRVSAVGGLVPYLFTFILAASSRYFGEWPILFGAMGLMNAITLAVALESGRARLLRRAAILVSITLVWWALRGLKADSGISLLGATLSAVLVIAVFGLARRVALRSGVPGGELQVLESSALAGGAGLGMFGVVMIAYDRASPIGPFLILATALVLLLIEMSDHDGRPTGALAISALGVATLTQIWFFSAVTTPTLLFYLAGPVVVSLLLSLLAERRARRAVDAEAELGVQLSGWVSLLGLFAALRRTDGTSSGWPLFLPLASTGWPLFLALSVQFGILIRSILRSNWTIELPALLGASTLQILLWERLYLTPEQHGVTLAFITLAYLLFLFLPLVLMVIRRAEDPVLWFTSAMSGPALYLAARAPFEGLFGAPSRGLLPAGMAIMTLAALAAVDRRYQPEPGDARRAQLRVRYLTLFSTVAAGLVALSIGVQLDRQWATLGWAIEATALCWLFTRLPHPALPVGAGLLYAIVTVRLLFNPAVLTYEARGLPILNWILLTYGIGAGSCWLGQRFLRQASSARWIGYLAGGVSLSGLLQSFWLVNLEILDFFSAGAAISLSGEAGYSVKLAFSVGWGVYAVALLGAGVALNIRPLRYLSLAFMILTMAKVFLYDLAALGGFFQVFSFFGLAAGLLMVSFFYQRFVSGKRS